MFKKTISLILSLSLIITQPIFAQGLAQLNLVQYLGQAAHPAAIESFRPAQLRYFSYDNLNNNFRILLDKGDLKDIKDNQLKEQAKELMDYFLIGVTLSNDAFWVNLRPDSPDNIIDPELEKTGLGKILLEADLQLKKDTASFTSPQTPEGKAYWNKLYKKAGELFGSENITIPTLTRPWIVPGEIIVRESQDSAYIYKATLKVMLEADYLKNSSNSINSSNSTDYSFNDPRLKELNEYSTQIIRETIIPKLTQEVNSSKRYAQLRQVYYSLVLSRWFKMRFSGKSGQYAGLIDKHDLTNLTTQEPYDKQTYFKEYQKSFAQGEYNLKEPVHTPSGQSIRSYMSGGLVLGEEVTKAISGSNTKVVVSPVERQLLNKEKVVVLDNNFKIVNSQLSLVTVASPLGEKLTEDDKYNNIRYVKYEKLSDLTRANLWNSFKKAASNIGYDPEYNWGFAVELNKSGGIGWVLGAVVYKKDTETEPVTYVFGDSEAMNNDITVALKAKVKQEKADSASPLTMDKVILNMRKLIKNIQNNFDQYPIKGIFLPDNYNEYSKIVNSVLRELNESKSPWIIKMITDGMNAEIAKDKEEAENAFKASYKDSDEGERNKKETYHARINILNQLKKLCEYADEYEENFKMLLFINMSVLFDGILEIGQSERTIFSNELDGIFKKEFERLSDSKKFIQDNFYDAYMSKTPFTNKYLELDTAHFMIQKYIDTPEGLLNKDWAKLEEFIFRALRQYYLGIVNEIYDKNSQEVKTAARKLKEILEYKTYVDLARINMDEYQNYVVLVSMARLKKDRKEVIPSNLPIVSLAQPPETVASPLDSVKTGSSPITETLIKELKGLLKKDNSREGWLNNKERERRNELIKQLGESNDVKAIRVLAQMLVPLTRSFVGIKGAYYKLMVLGTRASINPFLDTLNLGTGDTFPHEYYAVEALNKLAVDGNPKKIEEINKRWEHFHKFERIDASPWGKLGAEEWEKIYEQFFKRWSSHTFQGDWIQPSVEQINEHFKKFGLSQDIPADVFKKKARATLMENHPDRHMEKSEEERKYYEDKTKELLESYEVIINWYDGQKRNTVSSAVAQEVGGIDFTARAMKIGLEPMGSFADLKLVLPEVANVAALDLDSEFKQIQAMASSGIRPADSRILEFAAACYYRGEFSRRLGEITSCLQQAHFLDERLGKESSQTLRLATMLPEALNQ